MPRSINVVRTNKDECYLNKDIKQHSQGFKIESNFEKDSELEWKTAKSSLTKDQNTEFAMSKNEIEKYIINHVSNFEKDIIQIYDEKLKNEIIKIQSINLNNKNDHNQIILKTENNSIEPENCTENLEEDEISTFIQSKGLENYNENNSNTNINGEIKKYNESKKLEVIDKKSYLLKLIISY